MAAGGPNTGWRGGLSPKIAHNACRPHGGARAREGHQHGLPRVHDPKLRPNGLKPSVVRSEEEVVGRVGHELSLTRGAGAGRNSSAVGVQTLDEGRVSQEVTAGRPLFIPD